jgi:hypothetical protein
MSLVVRFGPALCKNSERLRHDGCRHASGNETRQAKQAEAEVFSKRDSAKASGKIGDDCDGERSLTSV